VHVLTKIFVVLVSLLAVLLVPLVVVYTHNENSYKERYQDAQAEIAAAKQEANRANATLSSETSRLTAEIGELENVNSQLRRESTRLDAEIRQLEAQLAQAEAFKAQIDSKLTTLASALETGSDLNAELVQEVKNLRASALDAERRRAELDEAFREVSSQLEVATEARRALQEELQRMNDSQARAQDKIRQYVALYGTLGDEQQRDLSIAPDINLRTQVIRVERSADRTLVEIAAGSRDGIRENWGMVISDGGTFIGNLRVTQVDVNTAIGEVTLVDPAKRGAVQVGQSVWANKGR